MISKNQIDKLGKKLKQDIKLTRSELTNLYVWRNSYSSTMDYYHQRLIDKIDNKSLVAIAKRIKRIESIKIKLKRFSSMRLSTLQDVAGLRAI